MAEIFWKAWSNEFYVDGIEDLFDAILLKKATPFPDLVIIPEFKENEKIVLLSSIPSRVSIIQNRIIMDIVDKILLIIPSFSNIEIVIHTDNLEIEEIWNNNYKKCRFVRRSNYIDLKKPERYYSPFYDKQPKKDFLKNWYLPEELESADQIIPIIPVFPSPIFQIHGVISSFFNFLPSKIKNEILIHKNKTIRTNVYMEIFSQILSKITLSGLVYQGNSNFAVIGNDPASVDAFASALMGIKASSVSTTKYCKSHKLCMGDLLKIHVQGERFRKPIIKDPYSYKDNFQLLFDKELCNLCNKCIDICPFQSIFKKDNVLFYYRASCNRCGYCVAICPKQAIKEV